MDQKEILLSALAENNLKVESIQGNFVYTQDDHCVEIKGNGLYKLSQRGYVKSNFRDLNQMCIEVLRK